MGLLFVVCRGRCNSHRSLALRTAGTIRPGPALCTGSGWRLRCESVPPRRRSVQSGGGVFTGCTGFGRAVGCHAGAHLRIRRGCRSTTSSCRASEQRPGQRRLTARFCAAPFEAALRHLPAGLLNTGPASNLGLRECMGQRDAANHRILSQGITSASFKRRNCWALEGMGEQWKGDMSTPP